MSREPVKTKKKIPNDQFLVALGMVLKNLRKEKGYPQVDVAEAIKKQRTYVSEVESGKRNLTIDSLRSLASHYEIELSALFENVERLQEKEPP